MNEINLVEDGIVVIACLDMVAADIARSTSASSSPDRAVEVYLAHLHHKLIDKVDEADGKLVFGVVAPIYWSTHPTEVKRALRHAYECMKHLTVEKIWFSDPTFGINAGADGVHLTQRSAQKYIELVQNLFIKVADESRLGPLTLSEYRSTQEGTSSSEPMEEDPDAVVSLVPPIVACEAIERQVSFMSASIIRSMSPGNRQHSASQDRLMAMATPLPDLSLPPPSARTTLTRPDQASWINQSEDDSQSRQQEFDVRASVNRIERKMGMIEAKSFHDDLMMALLKEAQDTEANKALLNKVTITGVYLPDMTRLSVQERIKTMKDKIESIVNCIKDDGQEFELKFVKHLNKHILGQKRAVIEVKFGTVQQATDFRMQFIKKRKEVEALEPNEDGGRTSARNSETTALRNRMNVAPAVRLATRVRVEIMNSIAVQMKKQDPTIVAAYCLQFIPKPVIKVVRKNQAGTELIRNISFIEAICWTKEQGLTDKIDLRKAYDRAGSSFRNLLSQHFVVMN